MDRKIALNCDDGFRSSGFYFEPEHNSAAGIIVIHEAMGVTAGIKAVADDYARQGYHVVAPQLYDRLQRDLVLPYDSSVETRIDTLSRCGFDTPLLDIAACRNYLHDAGAERIGIVGFCYGGTLSWLTASTVEGIDAAVVYYGSAIPDFPDRHPRCPCLAHWGRQDTLISQHHIAALAETNSQVEMHHYDAGHAFNAADRPGHYKEAAARSARSRSLTFFREHLK